MMGWIIMLSFVSITLWAFIVLVLDDDDDDYLGDMQ